MRGYIEFFSHFFPGSLKVKVGRTRHPFRRLSSAEIRTRDHLISSRFRAKSQVLYCTGFFPSRLSYRPNRRPSRDSNAGRSLAVGFNVRRQGFMIGQATPLGQFFLRFLRNTAYFGFLFVKEHQNRHMDVIFHPFIKLFVFAHIRR